MPVIRPSECSMTCSAQGSKLPPGPLGRYWPKAGRPLALVGMSREPRQPWPMPRMPRRDVLGAAQPEVVRRHRERRVLVQQRDERVHVVVLEGRDVAVEQLRARRPSSVAGVSSVVGCAVGDRRPRALQRAVDRRDARVEQLGGLGGAPAQHLAQDEHRALAGGQVLQRGDERQAQRLLRLRELGRVAVAAAAARGRRGSARATSPRAACPACCRACRPR